MQSGVQWASTLAAHVSRQWFTQGWSPFEQVLWSIVPISPLSDVAQLAWKVSVEHTESDQVTYWITVENLTSVEVAFEGRYTILS